MTKEDNFRDQTHLKPQLTTPPWYTRNIFRQLQPPQPGGELPGRHGDLSSLPALPLPPIFSPLLKGILVFSSIPAVVFVAFVDLPLEQRRLGSAPLSGRESGPLQPGRTGSSGLSASAAGPGWVKIRVWWWECRRGVAGLAGNFHLLE